mgnify:CR=1 FL=1
MSWFQVLKKDMSYCICSGPNKTKGFTCKQHCKYGRVKKEEPRKGTGKKPKGSSRRLYTDENPDDTVPVKFRTAQDVRDTFASSAFKSKSHQRKSQIINLVEQRARVAARRAKDPEARKRLKAAHQVALARKESSKRKTQRMRN